jgi:hypothetical protein
MNLSSDEIDADCGLNHPHTARVLSKRGTPLKVLPFRGVIYITDNGENIWWNQEALEPNRNSIKNSITLLIKGLYQFFITQAVTNSIREEFSLYPIN